MAQAWMKHMKWISLALLVAQNTALVLLMRYSRLAAGPMYIASTAVATMEIVKLLTCLLVVYLEAGSFLGFKKKLQIEVVNKPMEIVKLGVPSFLYTVQNNLLYMALSNLDAATYSVCYQLKILTTAVFSVLILKRHISASKWSALVMLTVGVALAELSVHGDTATKADTPGQSHTIGFVCVLAAAVTSGFAGVYFEMILKGAKTSLWVRNIQMGIPSIALAMTSVYTKDLAAVTEHGFFYGYTGVVVTVILLQAIGGLVVAVVVKYADNILKGFAAAVSIITSCVLSMYMFEFQPSRAFILGALFVNASVFLYGRPDPAPKRAVLPTYHDNLTAAKPQDI